jgi:hypothetical protein
MIINPNDPYININTDPATKEKNLLPPGEKNPALQSTDSVQVKQPLKNDPDNIFKSASEIKLSDRIDPVKGDQNPWRIKSLHIAYGLQNVQFSNSDIHIKQPDYNTDVTLHNVKGEQRTSYTYIWGQPRFAPDEPEFKAKASIEFENHFGLEADIKHNKYTVQDFDQNLMMNGTINGESVNEARPFNSLSDLYDITAGNHQLSLLATYSIPLPSPKTQAFSFNTKLGPSAIVSYSHNSLKNPSGEFEEVNREKIVFAGYGATMENSLKYDLGSKLGGITLELSHSLSYLNFTNVPVSHGTASQGMWASQFALTIGKTFDFNKKK